MAGFRRLLRYLPLVAALFSTVPGWAQWRPDLSGYLANLPIYQHLSDPILPGFPQTLKLDLSRLRLRASWSPGRNTLIGMEYEAVALYASQNAPFLSLQPNRTRQRWDWGKTAIRRDHFTVSHFLDRLYLRQDFDWGNLTAGRQRVAWGSGRIWNPTDLFNPVNPLAFDKLEKDGADLLTGQIYLGNFTDLTLVVNPLESSESSNAGFRFRTNYRTYDLAVTGGYFDKRAVLGGDFAGNLWVAGFRGEGIVSADPDSLGRNYLSYILGVDLQFTPLIYGLVEFHFNGRGGETPSQYDLEGLSEGRLLNLGRRYLFIQTTYQIHPLVMLLAGHNINLDDRSGLVLLSATWSWRANADLSAGSQIFYGNPGDEYRYYPASYYLKLQVHF
ncbi:MAG: hypothetical protein KDI06_03300 [Calditrichaeota bacterium]|nr:hypothetical protein [Calditrichota bacterium]